MTSLRRSCKMCVIERNVHVRRRSRRNERDRLLLLVDAGVWIVVASGCKRRLLLAWESAVCGVALL
jgi:hypothetical protein